MRSFLFFFCLALGSCGYHIDGPESISNRTTVSVPYVVGDSAGGLTNELAKQLSSSGAFQYVQNDGQYLLKVIIFSDGSNKIGYRYDRKDSGRLKKNLIPVEGRRMLSAEVTLIQSATNKIILGPTVVTADAEYDYIDSDTLPELAFVNLEGVPETTIKFSLGQLDSIEGAQDDVSVPLYRHLAQKIVDGIMMLSELRDD